MLELIDVNRLQGRDADGKVAPVVFGAGRIVLEDVVAIAHARNGAALCNTPEFVARIRRGATFLDRLLEQDGVIYGVTTGYGDSCTVAVPPHLVEELPLHLTRFHGC